MVTADAGLSKAAPLLHVHDSSSTPRLIFSNDGHLAADKPAHVPCSCPSYIRYRGSSQILWASSQQYLLIFRNIAWKGSQAEQIFMSACGQAQRLDSRETTKAQR
jgi:hypothetical protein